MVWLSAFVAAFAQITFVLSSKSSHAKSQLLTFNDHAAEPFYTYLSVCKSTGYYDRGSLYVKYGNRCDNEKEQCALGRYRNAVNESGWGWLEVESISAKGITAETEAYAAGLAEGILTKKQIFYHHQNTVEDMCKSSEAYCEKLYDYLAKNLRWIRKMIKKSEKRGYWRDVNLIFAQLTGIYDGYMGNSLDLFKPNVKYDINPIFMLQLSGELIDLAKVFDKTNQKTDDPKPGRCSGLVKVAPGNKDLYFSHVAMSGYHTMNRVLKLYKLNFVRDISNGYAVSFSGYPGVLASLDDFVLSSGGLAILETTIGIYNDSLYSDEYIKPVGQIHTWIRSIIATRAASSAEQWTKIFELYNSGTYNNQWIILEYNSFTPGEELPDKNLLWVLEQIPGHIVAKDMSWWLKKHSYWPSYNIPYFPKISNISGFTEEGKKQKWHNWAECPRAKILKRDQGKVVNMKELAKLMRYNDYQHDPFSRCNCTPPYSAEAAMSTRGDLNPENGTYEFSGMGHRNHGGLDYKGTNVTLFKNLRFEAWGGPTYDPLPVFSWLTTDIVAKHYGQPLVWNFTSVETMWETDIEQTSGVIHS